MAEGYDAAIRRRLQTVNSMGDSATGFQRQKAAAPDWATQALGLGGGGQIRRPGGPSASIRNPGNYEGPRGNRDALRAFGQMLQNMGYRVGENSMFTGKRVRGGHVKNSRHYSDRAIDVNWAPGQSKAEMAKLDAIAGLAAQYGLRSIWRKPGHFNHAHFDY